MASKAKDEVKSASKESESPATPSTPAVDLESPEENQIPESPKRSIQDRVKDIEKRWGKELTEVMVDLHDHVFGTSPPHDGGSENP